MLKRTSFIFILVFIFTSFIQQSQLNAKHNHFLESMVFPVRNVMSHFYDDWEEIRGNGNRVHEGIDIRAQKGSPIVAIADGVVNTLAFTESSGYYIAIDHQNGWLSLYVHLDDDINGNDNLGGRNTAFADGIYLGGEVIAGQTIGYVGDSGNADGTVPHVHFEVRYMGKSYDIYDYIKSSWERFEKYIKFPKNSVSIYFK